MPSAHRHLVHRHARRILSGEPRDLAPGEARLFSYYAPSLTGGLHNISVSQSITAPPASDSTDRKRREIEIDPLTQSFIVIAPRFSLPPGVVDSVYPPPGNSVEHTILPHIVLNDPHLPWSRAPSHIPEGEDNGTCRSRTTWLALMVFSLEELQMNKDEINRVLQKIPPDIAREQSETCSLRMRAKDVPNLSGIDKVINTTGFNAKLDARDAGESTEIILVDGQLFSDLFTEPVGRKDRLNVAEYKYMAHVKQIATDGMVNAGAIADEALFSVVVCRRSGPIGADKPSMMIVHLVSLCWDITMPFPKLGDRVALTSLYSWTYTCLASKTAASTFDLLTNLGDHLNVLRTDDVHKLPVIPAGSDDDAVLSLIAARQRDGYALSRHRTVTGETTAAITRGPLVPAQVKRPFSANFTMQSNFGHDLAIFDPNFGLLDATYSNAWQLGKTLAMSDDVFCAALARLRNSIQAAGLDAAKKEVHALLSDDGYGSRHRAADRMVDLVKGLNNVNTSLQTRGLAATAFGENRWYHDHERRIDEGIGLQSIDLLSQNSPHIASRLYTHAIAAALRFTRASPMDEDEEIDEDEVLLYNEHNKPAYPDYALVYSWILDKVHLGNVPAHYLIPDPNFLPQETLRFFYVDANWTDAFIDGALSLANHWGAEPAQDVSRTAIKNGINERLRTPDENLGGWHVQMPRYGFIIRTQLLVQFPDLAVDIKFAATRSKPPEMNMKKPRIKVELPANTPAQQPILVQKRLAPDTMYLLFDAEPPDLRRITFTMPPHQQCFRVAQTLREDKLTIMFKKIYTTKDRPAGSQPGETLGNEEFTRDGKPEAIFNWQSRTLNPKIFGQYLVDKLQHDMQNFFEDKVPTSAVSALQLNDPILQLDIGDLTARSLSEPVPLYQLSTPGPPRSSQDEPDLLRANSSHTTSKGSGFHRARPESPTRDAILLAQYRELQLDEPTILSRSPDESAMAPPHFDLQVYAVRSATRKFIPSASNSPVDLVFAITQSSLNQYIKPLTRMIVGVPYGDMPDNADRDPKAKIPLLAKTADPPLPKMLSNMRLNVLKRWAPNDDPDFKNHVMFELVPRQQPGILVKMIKDASFRLPRAKISPYAANKPRFTFVKIVYEFLDLNGKPNRATFRDGKMIEIRSGP